MHSFKTILAILMAAMVNMVLGVSGIHATAMVLATTLVDTATSTFQHSVIAAPGTARTINSRTDADGCYNNSTNFGTADNTSTLIPWIALQSINDTGTPHVYAMFETLCKRISATILSRDVPYTHCTADNYTNSTYSIMAQLTYRAPEVLFDMRGDYDTCMGLMFLAVECPYGGLFRDVKYSYGFADNSSMWWTVQARPIAAPCPDCTAGLLPTFADQP
ncbi:hypothetical protein diail_8089 [Diaporthe ilicicola]|nr:hypothetical protein diail_8089 [Diaporthe ilicicola]